MDIEEIEVFSLGDLIDRVTPASPDPEPGKRRDRGVYRGTGDSSEPLLTSLDRLGGLDPPQPGGSARQVQDPAGGSFRDQLDLVGVDERRLFPDLDGVADQLRRYYS
jgi:hypothetical protein